jgi:hypothetical protein
MLVSYFCILQVTKLENINRGVTLEPEISQYLTSYIKIIHLYISLLPSQTLSASLIGY